MADLEVDPPRREGEVVLSPWILSLIWTLTAIAVWWCWYATWMEGAHADAVAASASGALPEHMRWVDPCISRWLPTGVATVSCVIAKVRLLVGGDAVPFLSTTTVLVGLKGLALGIEALLRP